MRRKIILLLASLCLTGCEYNSCLSLTGKAVNHKIVGLYWLNGKSENHKFIAELMGWAQANTTGAERDSWICWCNYYAKEANEKVKEETDNVAVKARAAQLHTPPL